jgi:hypothetical protein
MSAPKVRKFGATLPPPPAEIARLIDREVKRIKKLSQERNRIARLLIRANARKSALMRLGTDLARASLDGTE